MSKYGISLDLMKDSEVELIKDFLKIKDINVLWNVLLKKNVIKI